MTTFSFWIEGKHDKDGETYDFCLSEDATEIEIAIKAAQETLEGAGYTSVFVTSAMIDKVVSWG